MPTGAVTLVQTATDASASQNVPGALVPMSIVLGILLALLLVFVFERVDMRIDTPTQLAMLLGCRVTAIDGEPVIGAFRVWQGVSAHPPPVIGLVPLGAEGNTDVSADTTAHQIGAEAAADGIDVRLAHIEDLATVTHLPGAALILVPLTATETIDPARLDALVAVVGYGEPVRAVRRQAELFRAFGKAPIWALLTRPEYLVPPPAEPPTAPGPQRGQQRPIDRAQVLEASEGDGRSRLRRHRRQQGIAVTGVVAARGANHRATDITDEDLLSRLPLSITGPALAIVGAVAVGVGVAITPLLGIAVIVSMAGAIALVRRPTSAVLILGLVPSVSGLRRGFPVPGFRLSEILTVAAFVILSASIPKWRSRPWDRVDWIALAYVVASGGFGLWGTLGAHHAKLGTTVLDSIAGPLQFFLLFRAVRMAIAWAPVDRILIRLMLLATLPMTLIGALQYALPAVRPTINGLVGIDPFATPGFTAVTRATALFTNWHLLAGYETAMIFVATALLMTHETKILSPRFLYLILAASVAGLLLTLTATDIFGTVAGCALIGFRTGKGRILLRRFLPLALVAGIAFSPLIIGRIKAESYHVPGAPRSSFVPQTIAFRLHVWKQQYFPVIKSHLSTGWGPNQPPSITWPYSESLYLTLLLRGGLPLLAVYLAMMYIMASETKRRRTRDPENEAVSIALWTLIVVLVPMQLLFPYFITTGLPHIFWILAAVAFTPAARRGVGTGESAVSTVPA